MNSSLQAESTVTQSTSCCSLKDNRFPVPIYRAPSRNPVVESVRHEPQESWFFMGVTAPFLVQSTLQPMENTGRHNLEDRGSRLGTRTSDRWDKG